jgi:hypothetical protein
VKQFSAKEIRARLRDDIAENENVWSRHVACARLTPLDSRHNEFKCLSCRYYGTVLATLEGQIRKYGGRTPKRKEI